MNPKILITTDLHPLIFDELKSMGYNTDYRPKITNEEILQIVHGYEGMLISTSTIVDSKMLDRANQLKFIGRAGSGLEIIDLEYAEKKGVKCFNTPEGNRDAVAEQAIGMLLSLMHNIDSSNREVGNKLWNREKNRGLELMHKTVGLLGYGNTGIAMAKKLSGFDVRILAYDKYKKDYSSDKVEATSLETIFKLADVFSIHLPLTAETRYWIDYDFLRKFEKPIFLINTARGQLLRTADLIKLLREGRIVGAALDVLENENLSNLSDEQKEHFESLIEFDNVIITPHIAGWTVESKERIANCLLDHIKLMR